MRPQILIILSVLLISSFSPQQSVDALFEKKKDHVEMSKERAYESVQKAKQALEEALEAAKEGTAGIGDRVSDTAGSARDTASSLGEKVVDTVGGAFQGARDSAGNLYEGTKDRVVSTADAIREKAAQMAGMANERGEEVRGKAENLYEDANVRAKHAQKKAQSFVGWLWSTFWDIIFFVPRTIGNAFAWSWHTTCDLAEDTYEGAREQADSARQRASQYGQQAGQFAEEKLGKAREMAQDAGQMGREKLGEAVDRLGQPIGRAKETVSEQAGNLGSKVREAGDYVKSTGEHYLYGEQQQQPKSSWFRCQMERIFKTLFTLGLLAFALYFSFRFFLSPNRQEEVRRRVRDMSKQIREHPVVRRSQQQVGRLAKTVPIPVQHHEKTTVETKEEVDEHTGKGKTTVEKRREEKSRT
jgi:hypothetical protein